MISGSIAMNYYSIPRMTRDIDIVVELPHTRIDDFISLFPNSYFNRLTIEEEVKRKGIFNIIDHGTGFKLDFIIRKESEYYRIAFQRRRKFSDLETELWIISLEDLIIAKILWIQDYQSDQQMDDLRNLLLKPEKDLEFIRYWSNELKLNTFDLITHE